MRSAFLAAYRAALRSVDAEAVTEKSLREWEDSWKAVAQDRVNVLAIGKAAHGMAAAAVSVLGPRLAGGLIISDQILPAPHPRIRSMVGDHPYPGLNSLAAGRAALESVERMSEGQPLLVLVSGGGSALMEVPAPEIGFEDLNRVGQALVTGGVPISEMNTVRRHLSAVKNGGLAEAAGDRPLLTLLISDVVDGPASAIASGPTLADGTTPSDARGVLSRHHLEGRVPGRVLRCLEGQGSDATSIRPSPFQVIADGSKAAEEACAALEDLGLAARLIPQPLVGDAAQAAGSVVARAMVGRADVYWGETTVRIEVSSPGRGGRNQHAAAVAAGLLAKMGRGTFGAFATDGVDGDSDAAGGLVDAGTVQRGAAAGMDWGDHLRRYDTSPYLAGCGDLVATGPTGVNVGDLWMVTG